MEILWNISKLRTLLFNQKVKFLDSEDETEKLNASLSILQLEHALSYVEEIGITSNEYTDRINEEIDSKSNSNEKDIKENTNLAAEIMFNKNRDYTRIYQDKTIHIPSKRTLELVRSSSNSNRRLLNNLIKEEQLLFTSKEFNFEDEDGSVIYIYGLNNPLLFARKSHTYDDAIYLAHELGHVKHYNITKPDFNGFIIQHSSIFREVPSELAELKMIDSLKDQIDEVDRLYLLSEYITYKKEAGLQMIFGDDTEMEYIYSGLVAIYFFTLYKHNKNEYEKELAKFYKMSSTLSDLEIINELKIDVNTLDQAHKVFHQDYEKEVDKIRKYI